VRRRLAELGKPIKFLEGPGLSEGTLSHFFKGDFTDNTLTKIETRMETTFSSSDDVGKDAPPEMGGYSFSFNEVKGRICTSALCLAMPRYSMPI
jgi:hypothetical protein